MTALLLIALVLAAIPATLFVINLGAYRPAPKSDTTRPTDEADGISVLIPARNEAANIANALTSILAESHHLVEVVVLDDHSTDATPQIVRQFAERDPRVRLVTGHPLPSGWCGKQHACWQLAHHARHPNLLFLDADVRLLPNSIGRFVALLRHRPHIDLWSGVPRQITGSLAERTLLPLIHFVLLGYLPIPWARRSKGSAFGAGCGQLFLSRRSAYFEAGGHAAIRTTLHDGVRLPRLFRQAGRRTDLFDATDVAECRMYRSAREVWQGLGKNAVEGLAQPAAIVPWTVLLLGGQVLPALLATLAFSSTSEHRVLALTAAALSWLPRLLGALRFRQSRLGALLHPFGITVLVLIQWIALVRHWRGRPAEWRGRAYPASTPSQPRLPRMARNRAWMILAWLTLCSSDPATHRLQAAEIQHLAPFALADQFGTHHTVSFPRQRPIVLLVSDRRGSEEVDDWVPRLKTSCPQNTDLLGIADVSAAPRFLRSRIREAIRQRRPRPLMLDFDGKTTAALDCRAKVANLFVVSSDGRILLRVSGPPDQAKLDSVTDALRRERTATPP